MARALLIAFSYYSVDSFFNLYFYSRSYSVQDGCSVIGSARGVMNYYGGKLSCPLTGSKPLNLFNLII